MEALIELEQTSKSNTFKQEQTGDCQIETVWKKNLSKASISQQTCDMLMIGDIQASLSPRD
jgi:hypothetical protein